VCLKWEGEIEYEFIDPDIDMSWFLDPAPGFIESEMAEAGQHGEQSGSRLNNAIGKVARSVWEKRRTSKKSLQDVLVCPLTKGQLIFDNKANEYISEAASLAYPVKNGIPVMLTDDARKMSV
jgi:uncharacterized protein YbaR (Trm112 family)